MDLHPILFPTDFSPNASTALGHALFFAEVYDTQLHILHAVTRCVREPKSFMSDPDTIMDMMEKSARVQMEESLEPHRERVFQIIERTRKGGSVVQVVLDYVVENKIKLVVMGNHGRHLKHFFLGSVTEEVVRTAPCSILTVRSAPEEIKVKPIREILIPVDFSNASKAALTQARRIAAQHGARLTSLHVIQHAVHPEEQSEIQPLTEFLPEMEASRRKLLDSMSEKNGGPVVNIHSVLSVGNPYQEIVDYARKHRSDLIVMGRHGYNRLVHLLLGGTVERVIRMAPCPVLTLKEEV